MEVGHGELEWVMSDEHDSPLLASSEEFLLIVII